ncbi:hypothetical protein H5J22_06645 [Cetobacterium sp. 8H]|uniref:hypothetical protein n=1 Tax=Cetobacterium sp. 8H TaxID=2759681 RepID=UPI00163CD60A|nr:hypothetical protein [Cetobacterium sp. 8H]MBC2851091.1 hypothetical protein [Cetobacterium sp. 8H]
MKKLEINERGIILWENNEIINQGIYSEIKDIPYEVYEVISIFDELGKISLDIKIILDNETLISLKELIKNKKGILEEKHQKINNKKYIIFILILFFEIFTAVFLYFKSSTLERDIVKLKTTNNILKDEILKNNQILRDIRIKEPEEEIFIKNNISDLLQFFSKVFFNISHIEILEILEKKIIIQAYSKNFKEIIQIKEGIINHKDIKSSKLDFIKKEGEYLFYLIELEME